MIETGLIIPPTVNHSSNGALEIWKWLPGPTSQRTISVARYNLPIYLAYKGHGIGIFAGIATIEPDAKGIVPSCHIRSKSQNKGWENSLKLALHYRELMEQGKTKAEISRVAGVSRARVTQVTSLLGLLPEIQKYLCTSGHSLDMELLTERRLRDIATIQNSEDQLATFRKLILWLQFGIAEAAQENPQCGLCL